jgi:transposase-like protein
MISIENSRASSKLFLRELKEELRQEAAVRIEAQLEAEVEAWLHRGPHERRASVGQRRGQAQCGRCGSRYGKHFSRNGHRRRQLVTSFGVVELWLPRVVCQCGGSVQLPFSIMQPYQRIWDDVTEQIGRWAQLGVSLRQMQAEIGEALKAQMGLSTLNRRVQAVRQPLELPLSSVPPVIMLDAIWVSLLSATDTVQPDQLGRQRRVKAGEKVCILVALGLYPHTGRWGILGWQLADSESQAAWERLLAPLEARGLYRERGVELFIHDGGSGLVAALNLMYPHIPHQRCLFHKLRNLWQAIQTPDTLTPGERREFKRAVFQQVREVFSAATAREAQVLRDRLCATLQTSQAKLTATLCRDWADSMAFHRVLARFPHWPRCRLRTTSLLERVNRLLRRLFRAAGAFHSRSGLLATVTRVLLPFRLT